MKLKLALLFVFFLPFISIGQTLSLSENAEVSVLTFGPGTSLNDAFGHNAFRIRDKGKRLDLVYGYGQYDFDAPNFYLKFARGKLNYMISRHRFSDIYEHYSSYNRSIEEQVLDLTAAEKQRFFDFLETNYQPENRKYLYDFFYDNCATRIRDVSDTATSSRIVFELPEAFEQKTFRQLIYEHLNRNSWGSLGIDIALGSVIDKNAEAHEYMFLPKYIHAFFDTAKIRNDDNTLVKSTTTLFEKKPVKAENNLFFSPFLILGFLAILIIYITYKNYKSKQRSKWLDLLLFGLTGLIGILLLLLWFATDHSATGYNYNLLWAFPLNILLVFQLRKDRIKNWAKGLLKFLVILLCLMTLHWLIGVQVFAITLIPILIALLVRYLFLLNFFNRT